jgi:hypothetical protein
MYLNIHADYRKKMDGVHRTDRTMQFIVLVHLKLCKVKSENGSEFLKILFKLVSQYQY